MQPKAYTYKSGAWVSFWKSGIWYRATIYGPTGAQIDKIICDDRREALAYVRSFRAIARNL